MILWSVRLRLVDGVMMVLLLLLSLSSVCLKCVVMIGVILCFIFIELVVEINVMWGFEMSCVFLI